MPPPEKEPLSENKEKLDEIKGSKISLESTAHKATIFVIIIKVIQLKMRLIFFIIGSNV